MVAVETLALGKPTLVMADGGGIIEIVGAHAPNDVVANIAGLANRLNELRIDHEQSSPEARSKAREKRIQYSERFDIKTMARNFQETYGLLLDG